LEKWEIIILVVGGGRTKRASPSGSGMVGEVWFNQQRGGRKQKKEKGNLSNQFGKTASCFSGGGAKKKIARGGRLERAGKKRIGLRE